MVSSGSLALRVADPDQHIDLTGKHVHFVGIGGSGMSGLARIARKSGAIVSGSDGSPSPTTEALIRDGIPVELQQSAATVPHDAELVVISAAIGADHPEYVEARHRHIPVMKYAQLLGRLMLGRTGVAVAGTHGKSSTTSMLAHILIGCGLDPSFIVGANCKQIGGGSRSGRSSILVAEACEYDRSFHNFHPTHAVILNVEADHLDIYSGIEDVVESFSVFARKLPKTGTLLINHEMPHRLTITASLDCNVETIGFAPNADWRIGTRDGLARLHHGNDAVMDWKSPLPGEHMAYNAGAAAVLANKLGAKWSDIARVLETFQGLDRRMQKLGTKAVSWGGTPGVVTVVDDYGHHPTEIDTTLRALRRHYNPERLICVFQPHQHSRTRFLMQEFAQSFSEADIAIVPEIYFSRDSEAERRAVTSADLVDRLRQKDVQAMHLYPFAAIIEQLQVIARPGDLIVTMGAGDVWKIGRGFLAAE